MTTNYQTLVDYAWMSQASYLDLTGFSTATSIETLRARLRNDTYNEDNQFAEQQAVSFTNPTEGYRVAHQQANDGNGFSATVFSSNASGQYTIAVRGTEPYEQFGIDLFSADVSVAFSGTARSQFFAAYRYYKKLVDTGGPVDYTDTEVEQLVQLYFSKYENVPITQLRGRQDFQIDVRDLRLVLANDQGLGVIPAGSAINFAGHSLGGHVAVLLAEMIAHNGINNVSAVYTYNAPGMGGAAAQIGEWLGLVPGAVPNSKITNIVAEGGMSVTASLGTIWGSTQQLFIEHEPGISIANHLILPLSDSLALYNLFAKLDPSLNMNQIDALFRSASNRMDNSLEKGLQGLVKLFQNQELILTTRDAYYTALINLRESVLFNQSAGLVTVLLPQYLSTSTIVDRAKTDISFRYALQELNPFVVAGDTGLYAQHNQHGELDLYDPNTGEGTLTEQYLKDRAAFLAEVIKANAADNDPASGVIQIAGDVLYQDAKSGYKIAGNDFVLEHRKILFDGDGSAPFSGGSKADHLYGGNGGDEIHGNGGNDYLEGNAGADSLHGDAGEDVLLGGGGSDDLYGGDNNDKLYGGDVGDFLTGGKGNDELEGGAGNDIYYLTDGDGFDVIRDSDGKGTLQLAGYGNLTGGKKVGDNLWQSDDSRKINYVFVPDANGVGRLQIDTGSQVITVDDYRLNDLGIVLEDAGPKITTPPSYNLIEINGVVLDGLIWGGGTTANDHIIESGPYSCANFIWNSQGGDDWIEGGGRSDWIYAGAGNDLVEGGIDNVDNGVLQVQQIYLSEAESGIRNGYFTEDTYVLERDIIDGGAGNDEVYAQKKTTINQALADGHLAGNGYQGAWLAGDSGDDLLIGSAFNEVLSGGAGKDILVGGAGDDWLLGDSHIVANWFNWSVSSENGLNKFYNAEGRIAYGDPNDSFSYSRQEHYIFAPPPSIRAQAALPLKADFDPIQGSDDIVYAGSGNDLATGGRGNDTIFGDEGDDGLRGDQGDDLLYGGDGKDFILGDSVLPDIPLSEHGNDFIDGGAGDDTLYGNGGNDILRGGDGDDQIRGDGELVPLAFQGVDQLYGGLGNDTLWGDGGDDYLFGEEGADVFYAGDGHDYLEGGVGNDTMQGEAGDDELDGGQGDDILDGGDGNDLLLGGDGLDQLQAGNGDDTLDGGNGDDAMLGGEGNDTMVGGSGVDNMVGEAGNDDIDGGADNDVIWGDQGNDILDGGSGDNLVYGGEGDDLLISSGSNDVLRGEAGNDVYVVGSGNALIDDNFGNNTIRFGVGVTASSLVMGEMVDQATSIKYQVIGSGGGGQIAIKSGFLSGAIQNYILADGTTLSREQVMDLAPSLNLTGSAGADSMVGSGQADTLVGGDGNDNIVGGGGADTLSGDHGDDQLSGGTGNDNVTGGSGADTLLGGAGTDMLDGGADNDALDGGADADSLTGGTGNDQLTGGTGNDTLIGGEGSDTYYFARGDGQDLITEVDTSLGLTDVDTMQFGSGVLATDVTATRNVQDLILSINGTSDSIRIENYFARSDNYHKVEQIKFADGTTWTDSIIQSKVNAGTELADTIYGTSANNTIDGLAGDDYISGGDGNDVLYGSAGNDTLLGDNGFDILFGGADNDLLIGGAGGDSLIGDSGSDMLHGGDDNDSLSGGNDSDVLYGEAGSDQLSGGDGNDTLDGGAGDDYLSGGLGNDTYIFVKGTGYETLSEQDVTGTASTDVILMGNDIAVSDMQLVRATDNYNDLQFRLRSTGDTLRISNFFARQDDQLKIEQIRFGNNTVWDIQTIKNMVEYRSAGADTIIGYAWDDVIDGLAGDDDLNGVAGNDQLFGSDGNDTIRGSIGNDTLDGGADADTLYGDEGNDTVEGGIGNDSLYGDQASGAVTGDDTLHGGAGRDLLYGGAGNDVYRFGRGDGNDRIIETSGVDKIKLEPGIVAANVTLFRNNFDLILALDAGATQLSVAGYFGADANAKIEAIEFSDGTVWNQTAIQSLAVAGTANAVSGTASNDTFVVDNAGDTITEGLNQGIDTVQSSVGFTLGANLENLTLTGYLDVDITGNTLDNILLGNIGDNTLDGLAGSDTLKGGKGDDTYRVDSSDTVMELSGEGNDTVIYTGGGNSYVLTDNVENVRVDEMYGYNFATTLTGNALDNVIDGSGGYIYRGGTILDGGLGADIMIGRSNAADTYYVDNAGDTVVEKNVGGTGTGDMVNSTISYVLASEIENLTLIGNSAINGTGNASNNILDGLQNVAANTLAGGQGNDTYVVGANDLIVEAINEGDDLVKAYSSYTLSNNLEKLWLYSGGIGTGNDQNNEIRNSSFSTPTILDGRGGNDMLIGLGNSSDTYVFDRGYGADVAQNASSGIVAFGPNTSAGDIRLAAQGADLIVSYPDTTDTLTLRNYGFNEFRFADGTLWNSTAINQRLSINNANSLTSGNDIYAGSASNDLIDGQAGNDTISGGQGNDTVLGNDGDDALFGNGGNDILNGGMGEDKLYGNAGDDDLDGGGGVGFDRLEGGTGSDIYRFGRGSGAVTLYEASGTRLETDRIMMATNVNPSDVAVTQSGDTLVISINGASDTMLVEGFFAQPWVSTEISRQGDDLTIWIAARPEQRLTIPGFYLTFAGSDPSSSAVFTQTGDDLILGVAGFPQTTRVVDFYYGTHQIEEVRFADGTVWTTAMLIDMTKIVNGTDAIDMLAGTAGNDRMYGFAGNDTLDGFGGNDLLDGGTGNDTMRGGAGDDTYFVDSSSDVVTENLNEGFDSVESAATFTLANNVEKLTLTGSANINATGNTLNNVLIGNSGNNTLDGKAGGDSMTGGAGNDIYVVDAVGDIVNENLNEGIDTVQSAVTYTLGANLENLTLTATTAINGTGNALDNVLTGGSGNNILDGGAGNDTLNGGAGTDTLKGGAGNDIYFVDSTTDVITENLNEGTDTIQSSVTFTMAAAGYNNIENLTLTATTAINGTGNALDNVITGGTGNNILDGGAGNDTLDGGAGTDTLKGGLGNDIYIVDSTTDVITENLSEGTDTVRSSVTFTTLAANVENLVLTGSAAINGTGNTLNNTLTGNSNNNTLDGGAGTDTLVGGAGNDIYVVDSTTDIITELANEGTDTIQSSVTFSMAAAGYNNIENLTLTATTAINGTGNALDNVINGGSGNNVLDGAAGNDTLNGGAGTDTLKGGVGNDTYVVDSTTDIITENLNEGTDTIQSSVTFTMAAAAYNNVENLTLTATTAINGTGNALDNVITGGSGNNILDGGAGNDTLDGGAGTDTLKGGLGNDVMIVDSTTDVVTENLNEGIDTVRTSVTLTATAANVEVMVLTGTGLINGTDNALNNLLTGNSNNNTLTATAGNDILQGDAGNDTLTDITGGNNLFNGGAGADIINASSGKELFIGGTGNDTITTGTGADVIAFNRGDGQDIVNASTGADNSISLGGGIKYADLNFKKNANDLILDVGATEQITLKDWYLGTTNKSVINLQMIAEAMADFNATGGDPIRNNKVETFNFTGLVDRFDQARTAMPTLTSWALTNALLDFHSGDSDTAALGGDLAYQYGKNGSLSNMSFTPAQGILANAGFGTTAQALQSAANLQDATPRLG